jgi:GNAT superfamily N-acetyltransferase
MLQEGEVELVNAHLPLNRLDQWRRDGSTYLIAWEDGKPVGHAHLAWIGTKLGVPEIQDMFVAEPWRRRGIGWELSLAAEREAARHGYHWVSLSVSVQNSAARALYEGRGFEESGLEPERIHRKITLRGREVEVDDTFAYLVKRL